MAQQKITADQVDTLNQNTTGTASNVTGTVAVANGGTGLATLTADNVILGNGTSAPNFVAPGSSGNVLTSNGSTWTSAAPSGGSASNTYKEAVRVATTSNGTLATAYENGDAIDGVTLVTGDRILIKNQTTSSENGIYTVNASGAPTRATDFDTTGPEVANGAIVPVQFGTVNGGSTWQLVANGGTIGNSFVFAPVGMIMVRGQSSATVAPVATAVNTIAIGIGASTSNTNNLAIGTSANASGSGNNIAIGQTSVAAGSASTAVGNAASSSSNSATCVGYGATIGISASNSTAIGASTSIANSASNCIALGQGASITSSSALGSVVIGNTATDFPGQMSMMAFGFSTSADAVISIVKLRAYTTDATPTEVGSSTTGNTNTPPGRIILTNDSSYIFDCDIVARNTATDTETAAYNLKFAIRRGTNAASTTLVGTPVVTVIGEDTGTTSWDVGVTADTTNGRPAITVTGEAAKTIRWVANIRMTKVSG